MLSLAVTGIIFLLVGLAAYHWLASWGGERTRKSEAQGTPPAWFQPLAPTLDAAGLAWGAKKWLAMTGGAGVFGAVCGLLLNNYVAAAGLAIMFGALPTMYGWSLAAKYRRQMATALAAGIEVFASEYTLTRNLPVCFENAAKRIPEPARSEFMRVAKEIYAGYRTEDVLQSFARRLNNRWARQFVNMILMREESGADVGESLFEIARQMRRRQMEIWREQAEMAQIKYTYLILMICTAGLFLWNLPVQYAYLVTDPTGRMIVNIVVLILLAAAAVYIQLSRKEVD